MLVLRVAASTHSRLRRRPRPHPRRPGTAPETAELWCGAARDVAPEEEDWWDVHRPAAVPFLSLDPALPLLVPHAPPRKSSGCGARVHPAYRPLPGRCGNALGTRHAPCHTHTTTLPPTSTRAAVRKGAPHYVFLPGACRRPYPYRKQDQWKAEPDPGPRPHSSCANASMCGRRRTIQAAHVCAMRAAHHNPELEWAACVANFTHSCLSVVLTFILGATQAAAARGSAARER
ncbi:hypothetical protein FB451DRAFT_1563807, partial [Mycena latifolia]